MSSFGQQLRDHPTLDTRQYRVLCDIPTLCCDTIIQAGDVLEIRAEPSKNRLIVLRGIELHKVKRSTFKRCTEVISEQV